jgi:DNA-binding CsgD family transcriptional regulator
VPRTGAPTLIVEPSPAPTFDGGPGFLVVDRLGNPVYANTEAIQILTYPEKPKTKVTASLARRIRALIDSTAFNQPLASNAARRLTSGRRQYLCRVFVLDTLDRPDAKGAIGIVLERSASSSEWLSKIATEFRLTPRERQTLTLLGQGLTSREMAARMEISPNTVKAFLRVIMIKMGVSSRSSILGKVLTARGSDSMSALWPPHPAANAKGSAESSRGR